MAAKCRTERGPTGSAPGGPRDTTHAAPRVGDLDVAPAAVDHVPLAEHAHLRLERREPDEAEALALARLGVLLHLCAYRRSGRVTGWLADGAVCCTAASENEFQMSSK